MAKFTNSSIGILGGSFDPAHDGHIKISNIAIKRKKLKKLYWIITKRNPHKKKTFFSIEERIFQAKNISKKFKKIEVLYLDKIVKSSRSINIINYIIKKKNPKNLYFVIGSDILINFHKWKSWKKIVKLTKLVVFSRRGYDKKSRKSIVAKYLKNKIIFIENKHIIISSTKLRKLIRN